MAWAVFRGVGADGVCVHRHRVFCCRPTPRTNHPTTPADPFRALRHRGLLGVAITALPHNFGCFISVGFSPFLSRST
jgi:hypothetical protein